MKRGGAIKQPYDRVLVVCEGAKTVMNYLHEIERLASAYVRIIPSELGTDPLKIVESAIAEFERTRAFDKVFVVFDRDDHLCYANAIAKAQAKDKKLKNDEKKPVGFEAVVSVPSFELWLLLHFHDQQVWLHRDEALDRLRQHIPGYAKGMDDTETVQRHVILLSDSWKIIPNLLSNPVVFALRSARNAPTSAKNTIQNTAIAVPTFVSGVLTSAAA